MSYHHFSKIETKYSVIAIHILIFIATVLSPYSTAAFQYNEEAADLALMFQKGQIEETQKKQALYETTNLQRHCEGIFNDLGYGYRIQEVSKLWKLFEDNGYFVLMGAVYKNKDLGFSFVWVMKDQIETTAKLPTLYLKIGVRLVEGKKYPKGIIPK